MQLKFHCKTCGSLGLANSLQHIAQLGKLCDSCRSKANMARLRRPSSKELLAEAKLKSRY